MEITIGLVSVFLVGFLCILRNFKHKLDLREKAYRESFYVLKIALASKHQIIKRLVEATQSNSLSGTYLLQACDNAANKLIHTVKQFSDQSLWELCHAENQLNLALDNFRADLNANGSASVPELKRKLEMLAAAEEDVLTLRRAYNRSAEHYNRLLKKSPLKIFAGVLGYKTFARMVRFQDEHVANRILAS